MSHSHPISDQLTCAIYGMGRAGRSLFISLQNNKIHVDACFARGLTQTAGAYSNHSQFFDCLQSNNTKILFIAVPDDAIHEVAIQLENQSSLPPILAHLSGALSYDALLPIANRCSTAQFHPLASLDGETPIPYHSLTAICASQATAEQSLSHLANLLHLTPSTIKHGEQPLYHAAAVLTGNLSIALVAESMQLMKHAGIEEQIAREGLAKLLRSTADTVEKKSLGDALTGPIARGDLGTIRQHLSALKVTSGNEDTEKIYRLLSAKLIPFLLHSNKKKTLGELLQAISDELKEPDSRPRAGIKAV